MLAKGTVGMDQLNRLYYAGIPAVEIFADATGESAEDVQDALSKGEISAEELVDVVTEAMMEGGEKFPAIAGAAEGAGGSWQAVWGNMRTHVATGVEQIILSIDEMLESNGLPDMREMVKMFGETFRDVLIGIAERIPSIVEKFISMKNSLEPLSPLVIGIAAAFATLIIVVATINTVNTAVAGLRGGLAKLASTLGMTTGPMIGLIVVLGLVGAAIFKLWQENEEFRTNVTVIWESIKQIISSTFQAIMPGVIAFVGGLMLIVQALM